MLASGPGKADVHVAGKHRAHHFVRAAAVGKLHVQPLVREEALCQRHILRRIENGMRHLAHRHLLHFFVLPLQPARAVSARHTHRRSAKPFFIYYHPFFIGKPGAFRRAYSPCSACRQPPNQRLTNFCSSTTLWYISAAITDKMSTLDITRSS